MRRRSIDRMGNGKGQRPMKHKMTMSILDENPEAMERFNVYMAKHGATSRERVIATQNVVKVSSLYAILESDSKYSDSKELAKTKLRGLGHEV